MIWVHVVTLILVLLKLIGIITWSWWWVLSPSLAVIYLAFSMVIGAILFMLTRPNPK